MPVYRMAHDLPNDGIAFSRLITKIIEELVNLHGFATTTDISNSIREGGARVPHMGSGIDAVVGLIMHQMNHVPTPEEVKEACTSRARFLVTIPRTLHVVMRISVESIGVPLPELMDMSKSGTWKVIIAGPLDPGQSFSGSINNHSEITRFIGHLRTELQALRNVHKIKRAWKGDFDYSDRVASYQGMGGQDLSGYVTAPAGQEDAPEHPYMTDKQ